jgi:ATP-dependent Clp protease adapter protein ClpS
MELILHNDDKHTFKYVYAALIKSAHHLPIQAEQCTTIAHNVGKCSIKVGELDDLLEIKNRLEYYKLKVSLQ